MPWTETASRAEGASSRARGPPVNYGDNLRPSPWDIFTPPLTARSCHRRAHRGARSGRAGAREGLRGRAGCGRSPCCEDDAAGSRDQERASGPETEQDRAPKGVDRDPGLQVFRRGGKNVTRSADGKPRALL